jgi:hypothetical protein
MNKYYKYLTAAAALVASITMVSCDETDAEKDKGDTPVVEYVRLCNPSVSDSLLVESSMGSRIALIGHDLGDVQQVWFNDQKAKLNPTLVTSFCIIVDIPNQLPQEVTDNVKLITSTGITTEYPFHVVVPSPVVTSVSCQWGRPGDQITFTGDYFFGTTEQVYVTFPGGAKAYADEVDDNTLTVTVPQGADQEGYMSVTSFYGTSKVTSYKFRESDGMLCQFEPDGYQNSWGLGSIASEDGIDGSYLRLYQANNGEWNWQNALCWGYWNTGGSPIAKGSLSDLAVRFEANIPTWANVPLIFYFTNDEGINVDGSEAQAHWMPWLSLGGDTPLNTNGWRTYTIPLTDFKYDKAGSEDSRSIGDISQYTNLSMILFGAFSPGTQAFDVDIRIDNLRIVSLK